MRRCAVTRIERPQSDLVRFVAAPDGTIVPDIAQVLPGRGVWVTSTRGLVADAVRQKVFARSMKRPVIVPEDLAEIVEQRMLQRTLEALSLSKKAGLVITGFAQVQKALDHGVPAVLAHGTDAANDGRDKLDRKYSAASRDAGQEPRVLQTLTISQLSLAIGGMNVVHAALNPGGATTRFLIAAERLERYRSAPGLFYNGTTPTKPIE